LIVDITFLFTICIRIFSMEHSVIKAMADFVYLDDSFNFFNQGSKHWLVRTPCSENLIQGWTGSGARIPALNLIEIALFFNWLVGQWFISHNKNNFQNSSFMSFIFCDFSNFLFYQKNWFAFRFLRFISKSATINLRWFKFSMFSPIAAFNYRLHVLVDRQVRMIFCNRTNFNTFRKGDKTKLMTCDNSTIKTQINDFKKINNYLQKPPTLRKKSPIRIWSVYDYVILKWESITW